MKSVISAVTKKQHALIESPTGTGKTLALLCATIAALRANPSEKSRIIYCTRTHTQITNVFEDIARLPYSLRITPFASRKHSCIYGSLPQQLPSNAMNLACKLLRRLKNI